MHSDLFVAMDYIIAVGLEQLLLDLYRSHENYSFLQGFLCQAKASLTFSQQNRYKNLNRVLYPSSEWNNH